MQWAMFLLFLSGTYAAGVSYYLLNQTERLKFMALFWASVTFMGVSASHLLDVVITGAWSEFILRQIMEWGHIYSVTLVLGALMLFVRESKPEFSRSPLFYASMPAILIISYLLVYNTPVLKWWVLIIAEGGAVVCAVIIYGMYTYYKNEYKIILAGAFLFLITFIYFLMMPLLLQYFLQLVIQLILMGLLFISVTTMFTGYFLINRNINLE